jgi:plasmid stabilization system protein ParE
LITNPEAEEDLAEIRAWYQLRETGLGDRFIFAVDRIFARIADGPSRYPPYSEEVHRALVQGFPYSVYYTADDAVVTILAVIRQTRDPKLITNKLKRSRNQP